jgi:hypothetical protein
MQVQIYYNKNYIPFNLYINSIYNIFKTNRYFTQNNYEVSIINHISKYDKTSKFLILFLNYIKDIYDINTQNTKVILIHADFIINHSKEDQNLMHAYVNYKNINNSYLWEYNYLNIEYYNKHYINKKIYFIPLKYNTYLESVYNNCKMNIPFSKKSIDVLFMGSLDERSRRKKILDEIAKTHNVFIMNNVNNIDKYINIVENSKIILQIYSNENNMPFDYYRLALLYANKVFVISEKHKDNNLDHFSDIKQLSNVIIETDYDNIVNEVNNYLKKSDNEIETITNNTYEIFKNNDMDNCLINYFSNIL